MALPTQRLDMRRTHLCTTRLLLYSQTRTSPSPGMAARSIYHALHDVISATACEPIADLLATTTDTKHNNYTRRCTEVLQLSTHDCPRSNDCLREALCSAASAQLHARQRNQRLHRQEPFSYSRPISSCSQTASCKQHDDGMRWANGGRRVCSVQIRWRDGHGTRPDDGTEGHHA